MYAIFKNTQRFCRLSRTLTNNPGVQLKKRSFTEKSDCLETGARAEHPSAVPSTTDKQRREQMDEIVRHMQVLALLRDPTQEGAVEDEEHQVEYLLSAMNIADKLLEVDIDGVKPMHSLLENEVTYLRPDEPSVLSEDERCITQSNSKNYKFGMYVAPPIPATKVSRKVTKQVSEVTDSEDEDF